MTPSKIGSPELWLTPIIGLCLIGPLFWHSRTQLMLPGFVDPGYSGNWHTRFRGNIVLDILIGLMPLLAGACVQRLLRFLKWRVWIQSIVAGAICGITVGLFYFYALYPLANWALAESEGVGNDLDKYWGAVFDLGGFGGIGTVVSAFATSVLIRHRAT